LIQAAQRKMRILCAREVQNSIRDSVHKLLSDQINEFGLSDFYNITQHSIVGANGSEFVFEGIKNNINKIKSYEGLDVCWVEEAHQVSKNSWDVLIPTIRKEGSEIWVTFNPELDTDETYRRFVLNPPANAIVRKVNWQDNPWFPEVLAQERDDLRERDFDAYLTVWEGNCRQVLDGAIYASEIREAVENKRICAVPYDKSVPVQTFWDLGWADLTSIFFAQAVGFEYRIIDFYQDSRKPLSHYIDVLNQRGYTYSTDWLPHDARAKQLGTGRSIEEMMLEFGRKVQVVPMLSIEDGINAARTVFNRCYFDEAKTVDGLNCLRRYRYDVDDHGNFSRRPLHDNNSHAADAFRYLAVSLTEPTKLPAKRKRAGSAWAA
jgi:phage terminase large subunit